MSFTNLPLRKRKAPYFLRLLSGKKSLEITMITLLHITLYCLVKLNRPPGLLVVCSPLHFQCKTDVASRTSCQCNTAAGMQNKTDHLKLNKLLNIYEFGFATRDFSVYKKNAQS